MPQTRSRGTRASVVKPEVMGQVAGFLGDLPDKPKDKLSLKEAMAELSEPIQNAFDKGYTYPEIADILHDHGIQISAFTLKSYVPRGRRKTAGRKSTPATKKTRKPAEGATTVIQEPIKETAKAAPTTKRSPAKAAEPKASRASTMTRKSVAKATPAAKTTARKPTSTTTRKRKTT